MISRSEALIIGKEKIRTGEMTTAQANVYMVQLEGAHVVRGKIARDTRKALNNAVKNGELGHLRKDGLKPEIYFHKNARCYAIELRNKCFKSSVSALKKVYTNK